jgi:D-aspartate ligase
LSRAVSNLAIVVGGFVNGLGLARALFALGRRVIVITTQPFDMAQYSVCVSEHYHVADSDGQPDRLAGFLRQHAKEWSGAAVFPTNDETLTCMSLFHEELAPWFRLIIPPLESMPYILEKTRMAEAARNVGMVLPISYGPAVESVMSHPSLKYPVVVKPVKACELATKTGRKVIVACNISELAECIRMLANEEVAAEVYDLVPGPDSQIYAYCVYLDKHGNPLAECTVRKLRQSPPFFGIARVAELNPNIGLLREQSIELLRRIRFRGIGVAEFKLDQRDGSFRFFEINGRSVTYNSLLRQAKMDIAQLALADFVEGSAKPVQTELWPGVWIHLHADVLRSLQNWRVEQLGLGEYIRPYGRKKTFAVWSSKDPKPFFRQWSRTFHQAVSSILPGQST